MALTLTEEQLNKYRQRQGAPVTQQQPTSPAVQQPPPPPPAQRSWREKARDFAVEEGGRSMEFLSQVDFLARAAGLGVATIAGLVNPTAWGQPEEVEGTRVLQPPDPENIPEAIRRYKAVLAETGDKHLALDAYSEALKAGKYLSGAGEVIGSFGLSGIPKVIGMAAKGSTKVVPKVAEQFSRIAPKSVRPAVRQKSEEAIRAVGRGLELPWEVEDTIGRGMFGAAKLLGKEPIVGMAGGAVAGVARTVAPKQTEALAKVFGEVKKRFKKKPDEEPVKATDPTTPPVPVRPTADELGLVKKGSVYYPKDRFGMADMGESPIHKVVINGEERFVTWLYWNSTDKNWFEYGRKLTPTEDTLGTGIYSKKDLIRKLQQEAETLPVPVAPTTPLVPVAKSVEDTIEELNRLGREANAERTRLNEKQREYGGGVNLDEMADPILSEGFAPIPKIMSKLVRGQEVTPDELSLWNRYKAHMEQPTNQAMQLRKQQIDTVEEARLRNQTVDPTVTPTTATTAVPERVPERVPTPTTPLVPAAQFDESAKLPVDTVQAQVNAGIKPTTTSRAASNANTNQVDDATGLGDRTSPSLGDEDVVEELGRDFPDFEMGAKGAKDKAELKRLIEEVKDYLNPEDWDPNPWITYAKAILNRFASKVGAHTKRAEAFARRGWSGTGTNPGYGENFFETLGWTVHSSAIDRQVVTEKGKAALMALTRALHDPDKYYSEFERFLPPAQARGVYDELRRLGKWTEVKDTNFNPEMTLIEDYWYRGWKMSEDLQRRFDNWTRGGKVGIHPGYQRARNKSTFDDMIVDGWEPISLNPYEMWLVREKMGIRHRLQGELLQRLKKMGLAVLDTSGVDDNPLLLRADEWVTPRIGPAFEGKATRILNEQGEIVRTTYDRWVVPKEVAKRLENVFGTKPKMEISPFRKPIKIKGIGTIPEHIDVVKIIDWLTFIPKRAKLLFSLFQQFDFTNRAFIGHWSQMVDLIGQGKPIEAVKHLAKFPDTMSDLIASNFSKNARHNIREKFLSKKSILPGREGVNAWEIQKNGLSTYDPTILPADMEDLYKIIDEEGLGNVKGVWAKLKQIERVMRTGLFDGYYPTAIYTDMVNNVAPQMARLYPKATDAQLCGMIARALNKKYSTIPPAQSVFQNPSLRFFLTRIFFSVGEAEGLLRQASGLVKGDQKAFWARHWIGTYISLIVTANVIHFASTGKHLPVDRYVPIQRDSYGGAPVGYNAKFASPTLGVKGRSQTEITMDIVGQMDTVFRVLSPYQFLQDRQSVPLRAIINQQSGTDYFGAPIDEVGPGGIASRTAAFLIDMFAPIGLGQATIGIARESIPAVGKLLPPQEGRIGATGQAIQALGVNVRGETNAMLRQRMAEASGLRNVNTGEPVRTWEELTPQQKQTIRTQQPTLGQEEQVRTEIAAQRGGVGREYAMTRIESERYEGTLMDRLQEAADSSLLFPMESAKFDPISARKATNEARTIYYNELYGTIWDPEKKKFVGGVYDESKEFEEPEAGTFEHILWRYRQLFQSALDPKTGRIKLEGDKFEEEEAKFWGSLNQQQAQLLLNNIRIIEDKYPPQIKKMLNAGRYASSVKVDVQGFKGTYWDMEDHPLVKEYIIKELGASYLRRNVDVSAAVDEYLAMSYNARTSATKDPLYRAIDKAFGKSKRSEKGILWQIRNYFISRAVQQNPGWVLGMFEAGYNYQGSENINFHLAEQLRAGRKPPRHDYEQLYLRSLVQSGALAAA